MVVAANSTANRRVTVGRIVRLGGRVDFYPIHAVHRAGRANFWAIDEPTSLGPCFHWISNTLMVNLEEFVHPGNVGQSKRLSRITTNMLDEVEAIFREAF